MEKKEIAVEQKLVDYIQGLDYDTQAHKEVIAKLIEDHKNDSDASVLTSPVFIAYSKELANFKAQYEMAKGELEETYISEYTNKGYNVTWSLNYATNVLTLEIYGNDKNK